MSVGITSLILIVVCITATRLDSVGTSQRTGMSTVNQPEIQPKRPECAMLLPQRGERDDLAKLIRAEQFLRCERDGFPKNLAPPWKTSDEGIKKLGDACQYFDSTSRKLYSQVGRDNLQLARGRCYVNVATLSFELLLKGMGDQ
ncbi:MAG: hypothetical protein DMG65_06555 [Candidatus Angelobacter sp. Gp1-AA117]|nr:MAG: hypothetical protein DMG65_06555 [Candidatus Angelobacter sp. Gp1-AA117]